jgi:hypothetical protein
MMPGAAGAARIAWAVFFLCAAAGSVCAASNAWWDGARSENWHDGSVGGTSNWYSRQAGNGTPLGVPASQAMFAAGAMRKSVNILRPTTEIKTLLFQAGVEKYEFLAIRTFRITGATGIRNNAATTPSFFAHGTQALLSFGRGGALTQYLVGNGTGKAANIVNRLGGETEFTGAARGGDAIVTNESGSKTIFRDKASAQAMKIVNKAFGTTQFTERSTGGVATFVSRVNAELDFSMGTGPNNDRKLTAGSIDNAGFFRIGLNTLSGLGMLRLRGTGQTTITVQENGGGIQCENAVLAGTIILKLTAATKRNRTYTLIRASKSRQGQFTRLFFDGTPIPGTHPRLAYQGNNTVLVID